MYRQMVHVFRGFHDCFGDGRVRVNRAAQLFCGRLQLHPDAGFGENLGRVRADDVNAQNLVVLGFADDLDEAFFFADDARLARSGEGELADLHIVAKLARLRFRQAGRADLRVAVSTTWHEPQVDGLHVLLARDLFDGEDALFRREVREQWRRNHIADGINVWLACSQVFVNLYAPALDLDLRAFNPQAFKICHPAHGDEQHLCFERDLFAVLVFAGDAHARVRLLHLL